MKVTVGKMLTSEDMESRIPKLTHMVGQAFAQSQGKSDKNQAPYGVPQFLLAFGLDASSPKPLDSIALLSFLTTEDLARSPNSFIQLFVNAAHSSFGESYIGKIRQIVLDMAVSQKSVFFGPEKANAKIAADTLLRTGFKGTGISKNADSQQEEEEAASNESVHLETSNWTHVVCSLDATNVVDKRSIKNELPKMTRLKAITGIGIGDINRKTLGSWCSRNAITGTRTATKDVICQKIVTFVTNMERIQVGIGEGTSGASGNANGNFDRYRGINVLVSERMRPHMNQLGNLPSRDELDAGGKTNQRFF
jgi:hypothetical protein